MDLTGGEATLATTADGLITIDGESRPAAEVANIVITGSDVDDTLILDLAAPLVVPVSFDGRSGNDTLVGPANDVTWQVTAPDEGTVAGVDFEAVENLTGAPNNNDTFVLGTGGSVSGNVDGGTGGFDSLVFDVDGKTVHSTANDPHSGSISVSGTPINYLGLEPITNTGTASDIIFDLGSLPDLDATLSNSGGSLVLNGTTFESTTFSAPTGSLTINGGGARDKITISGIVNLVAAALTVTAEEIAVTGSIVTSGDVTLTAGDSASGGVGAGLLDCLIQLVSGDPDSIGTHCARASVTVAGGSITANDISISATSTVTPNSFNALIPISTAEVVFTGAAQLAASGNVDVHADSTVVVDADEDIAVLVGLGSTARVNVDGSTTISSIGGTVSLASTSTVNAKAVESPPSAGVDDPNVDAAVATVIAFSDAITSVRGTAFATAAGALTIAADNSLTIVTDGDPSGKTAGAGISLVTAWQTTRAYIDSSSPTPFGGSTVSITSDATTDITSKARSSAGGATGNGATPNSQTQNNANTAQGSVDVAGTLGIRASRHDDGGLRGAGRRGDPRECRAADDPCGVVEQAPRQGRRQHDR